MKNRKFFWGLISGLLYFILLALMSVLLNNSLEYDTQKLLTILGICTISGMVGGMA